MCGDGNYINKKDKWPLVKVNPKWSTDHQMAVSYSPFRVNEPVQPKLRLYSPHTLVCPYKGMEPINIHSPGNTGE